MTQPNYRQADYMSLAVGLTEWYSRAVLGGAAPTAEQKEAIDLLATATIPPKERLHRGPSCPSCSYRAPKMGLPFFNPEMWVGMGLLKEEDLPLYPTGDRIRKDSARG